MIGSELPVTGDSKREAGITLGGTVTVHWPDFVLIALIRVYRKLDPGDAPG